MEPGHSHRCIYISADCHKIACVHQIYLACNCSEYILLIWHHLKNVRRKLMRYQNTLGVKGPNSSTFMLCYVHAWVSVIKWYSAHFYKDIPYKLKLMYKCTGRKLLQICLNTLPMVLHGELNLNTYECYKKYSNVDGGDIHSVPIKESRPYINFVMTHHAI